MYLSVTFYIFDCFRKFCMFEYLMSKHVFGFPGLTSGSNRDYKFVRPQGAMPRLLGKNTPVA